VAETTQLFSSLDPRIIRGGALAFVGVRLRRKDHFRKGRLLPSSGG